jgi:hypothetical protein
LHSMQESPGSDKETIETHPLLSQTSIKPLKSHAQHIQKKMHTRKQTFIQEHISNIHRETTTAMKLNQKLSSINSICTWVSSTNSLSALLSLLLFEYSFFSNDTKEGAYIPFSLSNSTTIKSTINSYLTTLNLINAFLSTKDVSVKAQGPFTIYKVRFITSIHKCLVQQFQGVSKFWCWRCPTVFSA